VFKDNGHKYNLN